MSDLTLQERYDFQIEANRSLVEACGKAMDENDRLRRELNLLKAVHESAEAEVRQLRALVQDLLDNDPDDAAADGVTVLQVWRKEARRALEGK